MAALGFISNPLNVQILPPKADGDSHLPTPSVPSVREGVQKNKPARRPLPRRSLLELFQEIVMNSKFIMTYLDNSSIAKIVRLNYVLREQALRIDWLRLQILLWSPFKHVALLLPSIADIGEGSKIIHTEPYHTEVDVTSMEAYRSGLIANQGSHLLCSIKCKFLVDYKKPKGREYGPTGRQYYLSNFLLYDSGRVDRLGGNLFAVYGNLIYLHSEVRFSIYDSSLKKDLIEIYCGDKFTMSGTPDLISLNLSAWNAIYPFNENEFVVFLTRSVFAHFKIIGKNKIHCLRHLELDSDVKSKVQVNHFLFFTCKRESSYSLMTMDLRSLEFRVVMESKTDIHLFANTTHLYLSFHTDRRVKQTNAYSIGADGQLTFCWYAEDRPGPYACVDSCNDNHIVLSGSNRVLDAKTGKLLYENSDRISRQDNNLFSQNLCLTRDNNVFGSIVKHIPTQRTLATPHFRGKSNLQLIGSLFKHCLNTTNHTDYQLASVMLSNDDCFYLRGPYLMKLSLWKRGRTLTQQVIDRLSTRLFFSTPMPPAPPQSEVKNAVELKTMRSIVHVTRGIRDPEMEIIRDQELMKTARADHDRKYIAERPYLNNYYRVFDLMLHSSWIAARAIFSGVVQGGEKFYSDYFAKGLEELGAGIPVVNYASSGLAGLISSWNDRERKRVSEVIGLLFESHFEIRGFASQITLVQEEYLREFESRPMSKMDQLKSMKASLSGSILTAPLQMKAIEDVCKFLTLVKQGRFDHRKPNIYDLVNAILDQGAIKEIEGLALPSL